MAHLRRPLPSTCFALGFAAPLSFATPLAFAGPPADAPLAEPEDDHRIPEEYWDDTDYEPAPEDAEYPLAIDFAEAHGSNFTANGIDTFDYVVVHTMQGYYPGVINWFQNPMANVSAHFVMSSETGEVVQMVRLQDRAWHVGNSNSVAIGIEHEGFIDDPDTWYTWEQYIWSAHLARWIADQGALPLDRNHIVGHVELPAQTHTDPGQFWDWDLYMALIQEIVAEGRVEGFAVDRSKACTVAASGDTWLKATPESSDELGEAEKCFLPVGTELTFFYAGLDTIGHRPVVLDETDPQNPCAGTALAGGGYAFAAHFEAFCSQESMAPSGGVTVDLNGMATAVGADGSFGWDGLAPGDYSLTASGNGAYEDAVEAVTLDSFPGERVIVVLDPIEDSGEGGEEAGEDEGGQDTSIPSDEGPGEDSGTEDGGLSETGGPGASLGDDAGCGCSATPTGRGHAGLLVLTGLLAWTRRRRS